MRKEETAARSTIVTAIACVTLLVLSVLAWGDYLHRELAAFILGAFSFWTVSQFADAAKSWNEASAQQKAAIATTTKHMAFSSFFYVLGLSMLYVAAPLNNHLVYFTGCVCAIGGCLGMLIHIVKTGRECTSA